MTVEELQKKKVEYGEDLVKKNKSNHTLVKYMGNISAFIQWYEFVNKPLDKALIKTYYEYLNKTYNNVATVNSHLIAVNKFLSYLGFEAYRMTLIPQKREVKYEKELTMEDYNKLVMYAYTHGKEKVALIMETLTRTGMRVNKLKCVTVESLETQTVVVTSNNKTRDIYMPKILCEQLRRFCAEKGIVSGAVFRYKNTPLDSCNIWRQLKRIASKSGVNEDCVFPHNFRHLFAVTYLKKDKNFLELADILGHTSIETTKLYAKREIDEKHKIDNIEKLFD